VFDTTGTAMTDNMESGPLGYQVLLSAVSAGPQLSLAEPSRFVPYFST